MRHFPHASLIHCNAFVFVVALLLLARESGGILLVRLFQSTAVQRAMWPVCLALGLVDRIPRDPCKAGGYTFHGAQ